MERAALFAQGREAPTAPGDVGELLVPYMPTIRVPKTGDRVYKTECAFSYDSPVSSGGCPDSFPRSHLLPRPSIPRVPFPTRCLPGLVSRGVELSPLPGEALTPFPTSQPVLSVSDYNSPRPQRSSIIPGSIRLNGKGWADL